MHEHTTIPFPHQQLLTEDPLTEVVRQGAGSVLDVERIEGHAFMSDACDKIPHHAPPVSTVVFCGIPTSSLDTPQKSCDNGAKKIEDTPGGSQVHDEPLWIPSSMRVHGQHHMDTHARQPPRGETQPWLTPFVPASSARP